MNFGIEIDQILEKYIPAVQKTKFEVVFEADIKNVMFILNQNNIPCFTVSFTSTICEKDI